MARLWRPEAPDATIPSIHHRPIKGLAMSRRARRDGSANIFPPRGLVDARESSSVGTSRGLGPKQVPRSPQLLRRRSPVRVHGFTARRRAAPFSGRVGAGRSGGTSLRASNPRGPAGRSGLFFPPFSRSQISFSVPCFSGNNPERPSRDRRNRSIVQRTLCF